MFIYSIKYLSVCHLSFSINMQDYLWIVSKQVFSTVTVVLCVISAVELFPLQSQFTPLHTALIIHDVCCRPCLSIWCEFAPMLSATWARNASALMENLLIINDHVWLCLYGALCGEHIQSKYYIWLIMGAILCCSNPATDPEMGLFKIPPEFITGAKLIKLNRRNGERVTAEF